MFYAKQRGNDEQPCEAVLSTVCNIRGIASYRVPGTVMIWAIVTVLYLIAACLLGSILKGG